MVWPDNYTLGSFKIYEFNIVQKYRRGQFVSLFLEEQHTELNIATWENLAIFKGVHIIRK